MYTQGCTGRSLSWEGGRRGSWSTGWGGGIVGLGESEGHGSSGGGGESHLGVFFLSFHFIALTPIHCPRSSFEVLREAHF